MVDPELTGRARRLAAGAAFYDMMSESVYVAANFRRTLLQAFEDGARERHGRHVILEDPVSGTLTQSRFRIGVALLARKIAARSAPGETVGLMLPNANAAAVAFMAIQASGRVAGMLNFTAGAFNLIAACRTARIRIVLCSRSFVEKGQARRPRAANGKRSALRLAGGRARPGRDDSTSCAPSSIAVARFIRASPTTPRRCCSLRVRRACRRASC